MKYSKRYFVFATIILIFLLLKLNTLTDEHAEVEAFRGAHLSSDVFSPLISKNVNETGLLNLSVDGSSYIGQTEGLYVDQNMTVMAELGFVRDIFSCSARGYEETRVILQRGQDIYSLPVDSTAATKNGGELPVKHGAAFSLGEYYLPLEDLCGLFGYSYHWNGSTYTVSLSSENAEEATLPASFDLREEQRAAEIKNQGSDSTCWAYAAMGALESSCLPEEPIGFSAEDLINHNTYGRDKNAGGDYRIAASYLLSWTGPVSGAGLAKHVQEVHFFKNEEIEEIKWAVFKDGGVSSPLYIDVNTASMRGSDYYNVETNAYYYNGKEGPNHDIVIIGWDDHFPASAFLGKVPEDGAFIYQNSWGKSFGESGVFYVSYFDAHIGEMAVSYVGVEDTDNFDRIYQSDLCGQIGEIGYGKSTIYAANVYTAEKSESVVACGVYALGEDTTFRVSVAPAFQDTIDLVNATEVITATVKQRGFYTLRFDTPVHVNAGEDFAVVVMIDSPGTLRPLGIEYQTEAVGAKVDITDGRGYVSRNGSDWNSIEEEQEANICLKAYTVFDGR